MTIDELTQEQEIEDFFTHQRISDESEQRTYYVLFHLCGETHNGDWNAFLEYLTKREKSLPYTLFKVKGNITEDIERIEIIMNYERCNKLPIQTQSL